MEPTRLEQALWIEKKATRLFASEVPEHAVDAPRFCEHLPRLLVRNDAWAHLQCLLLASSIDRGRAREGIMLEICGEAADGPIWDPPSVVYWTT